MDLAPSREDSSGSTSPASPAAAPPTGLGGDSTNGPPPVADWFRRFYGLLYWVARAARLTHEEAEDAVEWVFLSAARADAIKFPRAWLLRRLRGEVQNAVARRPVNTVSADEVDLPATGDRDTRRELIALARELVGGLPGSLRRVIELKLAGFTYEEIAADMGMTQSRVMGLERSAHRHMYIAGRGLI